MTMADNLFDLALKYPSYQPEDVLKSEDITTLGQQLTDVMCRVASGRTLDITYQGEHVDVLLKASSVVLVEFGRHTDEETGEIFMTTVPATPPRVELDVIVTGPMVSRIYLSTINAPYGCDPAIFEVRVLDRVFHIANFELNTNGDWTGYMKLSKQIDMETARLLWNNSKQ